MIVSNKYTLTRPSRTFLGAHYSASSIQKVFCASSEKRVVQKVARNQTLNQLHVPSSKRNDGIIAWIPGIGAFQMTVGNQQNTKRAVRDQLCLLGDGANRIYWLLHPLN